MTRPASRALSVSLDDETYRRARIIAAERDTSVSALVKRFLVELTSGETEFERLKREEAELRKQITNFSASDRLSRDELYDRLFVRAAFVLGDGLWKGGDGAVIDGLGPDGVAAITRDLARQASRLQTGYVYHYAFAMMIGLVAFVTWYLFPR